MKNIIILLLALFILPGCNKEEVDPSTLTSNPFDPEYNGPPIFELIEARTTSYFEEGETRYRHEQDIRVRRDLMPAGATFGVYVDPNPYPVVVNGSTFTWVENEAVLGQVYCRTYQLRNGGGRGTNGRVCATAAL